MMQGAPVYKNEEIIFDNVRVLDKRGTILGEMSTNDGVKLAKSQGLDLHLIDFDVEPPTCVISDDSFIFELARKFDKPVVDEAESYSFDPTARPATIQFTVNIADEEFERKIDLLRRHLLDRRRCKIVVKASASCESSPQQARAVSQRILDEVRDIGKLADTDFDDAFQRFPVGFKVWPCDPDQTSLNLLPPVHETPALPESTNDLPDVHRPTRARKDPWLDITRRKVVSDD